MKNIIIFILTIIGTIIGAGFATGQELYSFFISKSSYGFFYFIISSFVIIFTSCIIYLYSEKNRINSQYKFLNSIYTNNISLFFNLCSVVFLYSCTCITTAGVGSLFKEFLNLPYFAGTLSVLIICCISINFNINGVYFINSILTPFIIFFIIIIGILFRYHPKDINVFNNFSVTTVPLCYSLLYSGYNIFSILPIIFTSKNQMKKKEIIVGFIISLIVIILIGSSVIYSLYHETGDIYSENLPFLKTSVNISYIIGNVYKIIIFFAMITTAVSCFYGFVENISGNIICNKKLFIFISLLISFILSFIGFTELLRKIYSLFGIIGVIFIVFSCIKIIKNQ